MTNCQKCNKLISGTPKGNLCRECFYTDKGIKFKTLECKKCGLRESRPQHHSYCRNCYNKNEEPLRIWIIQRQRCRNGINSTWQGLALSKCREDAIRMIYKDYCIQFHTQERETPQEQLESHRDISNHIRMVSSLSTLQVFFEGAS